MTTIPIEGLTWTGLASTSPSGALIADEDGTLTAIVDYIRPIPGQTITITVTAAAAADGPATLLVAGHSTTLPSEPTTLTYPIDPTRPLTIHLAAVISATIAITVTAPDTPPDTAEPWQVLALDVLTPIASDALHWDTGRWDRAAWDRSAPPPGTMIWDTARWDDAYWNDQTVTTAWTSILGPCTQITARRGVSTTGPILTAQTGTLTLDALDLDPRALGIVRGTPIRLYHWPTRTPIWSGRVDTLTTTPLITGGLTTQIVAVDDVALLVAITRYGARPTGGGTEPWAARIARLMESAPAVAYEITGSTAALVCPTVWETSLANHLDAAIATTGGAWWARRDGGIIVAATLPDTTSAELALTDDPQTFHTATCWHYYDGAAAWSSAGLTSQIEATNHDAAPDDDGEWRADDQTITVTDATTTAAWGGTAARVDLIAADSVAAEAAARRLLTRAPAAPTVSQASTAHLDHRRPRTAQAARMAAAARLDPLTPVIATQRGETSRALVASVTHTISPLTWTTTTDLTRSPS